MAAVFQMTLKQRLLLTKLSMRRGSVALKSSVWRSGRTAPSSERTCRHRQVQAGIAAVTEREDNHQCHLQLQTETYEHDSTDIVQL
jgi:hypothetical protein